MFWLSFCLLTCVALAKVYVGDITYYTPGLGSCGAYSSSTDAVVALSVTMMANSANPNANPKCFSKISIYNPRTRNTHWATVVDTCQACGHSDIDLSPALFQAVEPRGDGRVHGITWRGNMFGG